MEHQELLARVAKLAPAVAGSAGQGERDRRIPEPIIDALRDSGVFRALVPERFGGYGIDFPVVPEIARVLAQSDVSTAWVTTFLVMHNWLLAQFPQAVCDEVFADQGFALAPAALSPTGTAELRDGGLEVSGRWSWCSGVMHAEWVLVTAVVNTDGMPDFRMVLLSPDQVQIDDVWHTDGMRGTGSNDVVADGVFVPDERAISFFDLVEGVAASRSGHDDPRLRLPLVPALCFTAAAPLVGGAEGGLAAFTDRLRERVLAYTLGERQAEKPGAQIRLARAEADVRAAWLLLADGVTRLTETYARGDTIPRPDRSTFRMDTAHAVDLARGAVRSVIDAAGGSAHFLDQPLQRFARDLATGSGHAVFDTDRAAETRGRVLVGLEPGLTDML